MLYPLLFLLFLAPPADRQTTVSVREWYYRSVTSFESAEELYTYLSKQPVTPLNTAYRGATEALFAKHEWNPFKKVEWLKKAKSTLQKAIIADPGNVEIRFLRFSYQHFIPAFLNFSPDIQDDLTMIVRSLQTGNHTMSPELTKNVIRFLLETNRLTESDQERLSQLI